MDEEKIEDMNNPGIKKTPAGPADPAHEIQALTEQEAKTAQEVQELARQERDTFTALLDSLEKQTKSGGSTAEILRELSAALAETVQRTQEIYDKIEPLLDNIPDTLRQDLADANNFIKQADTRITEFCESDKMDSLQEIFPDAREWIESERAAGPGNVVNLETMLQILQECLPVIRKYVDRTKYAGTLADFMRNETDPDTGEKKESLFEVCLSEAEALPIVKRARLKAEDFPVDKINDNVWNLPEANTSGQLTYLLKAEKGHSKNQISLIYSINFDSIESDLPIVKRLTEWDKRAYIAMGALYNAGNDIMTSTQILRTMGYNGSIAQSYIDKLDKALTKFAARITLDNRQEIAAGYKYPRFVYDGDLLPFERIRAVGENGKVIDSAIHVFREPPLLSFARSRRQITTVKIKMLQGPFSKTEENLAIENYLIERIAHAKSNPQPKNKKILLSTIYEHAGITKDKQRQRAPEKIKTMLDYYVKDGDITGYEMDKTSITLEV